MKEELGGPKERKAVCLLRPPRCLLMIPLGFLSLQSLQVLKKWKIVLLPCILCPILEEKFHFVLFFQPPSFILWTQIYWRKCLKSFGLLRQASWLLYLSSPVLPFYRSPLQQNSEVASPKAPLFRQKTPHLLKLCVEDTDDESDVHLSSVDSIF